MRIAINKLHETMYLNLDDFSVFVDIDKVEFYEFKQNDDGTVTLFLYDKRKRILKPKSEVSNVKTTTTNTDKHTASVGISKNRCRNKSKTRKTNVRGVSSTK